MGARFSLCTHKCPHIETKRHNLQYQVIDLMHPHQKVFWVDEFRDTLLLRIGANGHFHLTQHSLQCNSKSTLYPHHHGRDDGNTNETQIDLSTDSNIFFMSCSNPDKLPSRAPKWLKWPYRTHIWRWKTRNGDQWVIDDLSLLVLGQGEYPLKLVTPKLVARSMVTNSQEITNITCILVTSNVGQLNMWVLYKKNGPTRAKKLSLAQLDQIQMAQMAIITIRIQHCALAQKGLQTRNGDQFVSFCLPFFYPNLWNLIWRWPTWTGHRRPQTRHNEHQLHVANSSSWPSSCKSCVKKIDPTGAKKPSMPDKQHQIGSHGH